MKSKVRLWSLVVLILVLLFLVLFPARVGTAAERTNVAAPSPAGHEMTATYFKLPLSFEANQGQTDARVKFLSRGSGYTLFLTGNEAVLSLRKSEVRSQKSAEDRNSKFENRNSVVRSLLPTPHSLLASSEPRTPAVLHMKLIGANPAAKVVGLEELPGKSNYFLGKDPKKWRTNVPTYARVKYANVYPGVDVVYYGNQWQLEYDFVVSPGADPQAITLEIQTVSGGMSGTVCSISEIQRLVRSRYSTPGHAGLRSGLCP